MGNEKSKMNVLATVLLEYKVVTYSQSIVDFKTMWLIF